MVRNISFLRGLPEARITRFPTNFSSDGTRKAWGSTQLCFGKLIGFDLKKFMTSDGQEEVAKAKLEAGAALLDASEYGDDRITDAGITACPPGRDRCPQLRATTSSSSHTAAPLIHLSRPLLHLSASLPFEARSTVFSARAQQSGSQRT